MSILFHCMQQNPKFGYFSVFRKKAEKPGNRANIFFYTVIVTVLLFIPDTLKQL